MKTSYIITTVAAAMLTCTVFAQKTNSKTQKPAATSTINSADQSFIQDAINSNNEAMMLAQMALQQSTKEDVKKIAGQLLNDHRAAQQKLYSIAQIKDSVHFQRYMAPATATRLPMSDNLNSRRNRTITSITEKDTANTRNAGSNTVATNNNNTANNNQGSNPYTGTSNTVINRTYNGNTSIDNAVGVNNANRTDIGGYSGRWTENTTVVNNQPVTVAAQPAINPVTSASSLPNGTVANTAGIPATGTGGTLDNTPNFPNRTIDTVRQTGASDGFQNPGTNLSFPGNDRYSRTTPNTRPNNNAGSDYGYTGVAVNNTQTNALNTAAYSNNEINGNIVQTGQLQGTYNPTAVINSSTTSMNNNQVAFNNANANRANDALVQVKPNRDIVIDNRTSNPGVQMNTGAPVADTSRINANPILVGRAGGNTAATQTNRSSSTGNTANTYYTNAPANTSATSIVSNSTADNFDKTWANQMLVTQQLAAQKYQSALRRTRQPQVRAYINTVLPLLQGHQYALQQWQSK